MEVGSEAMHVLVIGQHGMSLGMEEVDVPDAKQSQQDWSVLIQRSGTEVVVLEERKLEHLYYVISLHKDSQQYFFYS